MQVHSSAEGKGDPLIIVGKQIRIFSKLLSEMREAGTK